MKIIIYILYVHDNVSTILHGAILIHGFDCVIISFQSYRISFYIENTCWFRHLLIYTTKQVSQGK